jgi:ribosomal protein S18 acetylase RimI-like enzyme
MHSSAESSDIVVRPFAPADRPLLGRIARRLNPGRTASPRDPAAMDRYVSDLAQGRLLTEPGAEAFVATVGEIPSGIVAVHPDADYFTGHRRAYVDILVVAPEAEGRGVGRALLQHVERWAQAQQCREVVLDVFAGNDGAMAFYERCDYQPDHVRMVKPLD